MLVTPSDSKELFYGELSYTTAWIGGELWSEIGTSITTTQDGTASDDQRFQSQTERVFGRLAAPIIRTRALSLWASVMLDSRDNTNEQPTEPTTQESLRVLRGSFSYTDDSGGAHNDVSLELSRGLNGLGASRSDDTLLSLSDSRPQFTKVRISASRTQPIWNPFELYVTAMGQFADGSLPSSEELSVGGARFGRAYDYGELSGDNAIAGGIELRVTTSVDFIGLESLQLFAFADAAEIWNLGTNPSGYSHADLSSAGAGLRLTLSQGLVASAEFAKPLSKIVTNKGDRDPRFFFALSLAM